MKKAWFASSQATADAALLLLSCDFAGCRLALFRSVLCVGRRVIGGPLTYTTLLSYLHPLSHLEERHIEGAQKRPSVKREPYQIAVPMWISCCEQISSGQMFAPVTISRTFRRTDQPDGHSSACNARYHALILVTFLSVDPIRSSGPEHTKRVASTASGLDV